MSDDYFLNQLLRTGKDYKAFHDEIARLNGEIATLRARVAELEARDDSDKRYIIGKVDKITDGFGSYWLKNCPNCGAPMQVVRPGFARCSKECYIKPEG